MKKTFFVVSLLLLFSSFLLPPHVKAAADPIAHFKFDDGSGTTPNDSSTNNISASFTATNPTWSTDVSSTITFTNPYSLDFTGNGDGVTVSWPADLDFAATDPRSFSFWYKPVANGEGQYSRIISWSNDRLEIAGTNGTTSSHKIAYFDGNWNDTDITLTIGIWYHVIFTYNGTVAKFYINNELQDEHSLAGRALSGTLRIGNRVQQLDEGINGKIDDVRIYDYALNENQIENLSSGSNNPDGDPTPTPTPTSVPSSNSQSINTSPQVSSSPTCTKNFPTNAPDLFQVDTTATQAKLYFSPANNADRYVISYGQGENTTQHGAEVITGNSTGVLSYTINHLIPNTKYSFIVRGGNGCMPGNWSNTIQITTRNISSQKLRYYKNFIAQILSIFPKQINNVGSTELSAKNVKKVAKAKSCQTYTVQPGDSFWSIAEKQLGSGNEFISVMKANKIESAILNPGQKIKVGC